MITKRISPYPQPSLEFRPGQNGAHAQGCTCPSPNKGEPLAGGDRAHDIADNCPLHARWAEVAK